MSQTKTSLMGQCISEFIGTALLVFFGLGCVAAARIAGAQLGLWEISQSLLAIKAIFGDDLPANSLFTAKVTEAYLSLLAHGAKATVAKYSVK